MPTKNPERAALIFIPDSDALGASPSSPKVQAVDREGRFRRAGSVLSSERFEIEGGGGGGHGGPVSEHDYRLVSSFDIVKERLPWLIFFFIGLLVCAAIVDDFDYELRKQVALSYFVPLIIGHGGNTGSQTVSTVIRALALGQMSSRDLHSVLTKEAGSAGASGLVLGALVFLIGLMSKGISNGVAATVAVTLPLVSIWSAALGTLLPVACVRIGVSPATVSAPLATTLIDSTGLLIYFALAKLFIRF